jgi:site-specific DNA-cytosine methylase
MGYSESECNGLNKTEWKGRDTTSTSSEFIMGNPSSERLHRRSENRCKESSEMLGKRSKDVGGQTKELANSDSIGSGKDRRETKLRTSGTEQPPEGTWIRSTEGEVTQGQKGKTESQRWPSRPGEPQHDWEEPRTTPKPQLGGASNGASSRVDRLRLLGNGVVPQTVEVAFRTLSKRIEERIKLI